MVLGIERFFGKGYQMIRLPDRAIGVLGSIENVMECLRALGRREETHAIGYDLGRMPPGGVVQFGYRVVGIEVARKLHHENPYGFKYVTARELLETKEAFHQGRFVTTYDGQIIGPKNPTDHERVRESRNYEGV